MLIYFKLFFFLLWWVQDTFALKVGSIQNARIKAHKRDVLQDVVSHLQWEVLKECFNP